MWKEFMARIRMAEGTVLWKEIPNIMMKRPDACNKEYFATDREKQPPKKDSAEWSFNSLLYKKTWKTVQYYAVIYMCVCVCIYIYIEREREGERKGGREKEREREGREQYDLE